MILPGLFTETLDDISVVRINGKGVTTPVFDRRRMPFWGEFTPGGIVCVRRLLSKIVEQLIKGQRKNMRGFKASPNPV
jgi:hypothetical protein